MANSTGTHRIISVPVLRRWCRTDDAAELPFDVCEDRHDMYLVQGEKLAEMRQALVAHLQAENHPHVQAGVLLNEHKSHPSLAEALAQDGAALSPLDGSQFAARHALHLDLEGPLFQR